MAVIRFLGDQIADDNAGNIILPPLGISPSVGAIPTQRNQPFPAALYQSPSTPDSFIGLSLLNYFNSILKAAAQGGSFGTADTFRDFTNNDDPNGLVPPWTGFGPNLPGGVRALGGNDNVIGSVDNDVVNGNQGNDFIDGNDGFDFLRGGQGNDNLLGKVGKDILNGNKDNDTVDGGDGDDILRGGNGDDALIGGAGDDVLIGDVGRDILTGGAGANVFVFRADSTPDQISNIVSNEFSADVITDFVAGFDSILCNGLNRSQIQLDDSRDINGDGFNDTLIRVPGGVLGVVQNTAAQAVFNSFYNIGADSNLVATIG